MPNFTNNELKHLVLGIVKFAINKTKNPKSKNNQEIIKILNQLDFSALSDNCLKSPTFWT